MKKYSMNVILMVMTMIVLPFGVLASDGENQDMTLTILPEGTLFDIDDMKPGDWAPRTIEVQNNGPKDFSYSLSILNNGDHTLFNELFMEISRNEENLYDGKLADFDQLPFRDLASKSGENLQITIHFPEHLGNEFQGLDVHFSLVFTAEEVLGKTSNVIIDSKVGSGDVQKSNVILPNTATNIFTIMLIGVVFFILGGIFFIYTKRIKQ